MTPVYIQEWQSTTSVVGARYQYIYTTTGRGADDSDRKALEDYARGRDGVKSAQARFIGTTLSLEWEASKSEKLPWLMPKYFVYQSGRTWEVTNVFHLVGNSSPLAGAAKSAFGAIREAVSTTIAAATGATVKTNDGCGDAYGGAADFLAEFLGGRDRRFFGVPIPFVKPADQYPECDPRYQKRGSASPWSLAIILGIAGLAVFTAREIGLLQVIRKGITK